MKDTVSIAGLDKALVLAALYNASRPQGMGFMHYDSKPMTREEAQAILDEQGFGFDYLKGRVMKCNIENDEMSPWGFDRDNGQGTVAKVIAELRKSGGDTNPAAVRAIHANGVQEGTRLTRPGLGKESTLNENGMTLGLADVADELGPKINRAVKHSNQ